MAGRGKDHVRFFASAGGTAVAALSGSFARVDSYLSDHCPVDSQLAQEVIDEYE